MPVCLSVCLCIQPVRATRRTQQLKSVIGEPAGVCVTRPEMVTAVTAQAVL